MARKEKGATSTVAPRGSKTSVDYEPIHSKGQVTNIVAVRGRPSDVPAFPWMDERMLQRIDDFFDEVERSNSKIGVSRQGAHFIYLVLCRLDLRKGRTGKFRASLDEIVKLSRYTKRQIINTIKVLQDCNSIGVQVDHRNGNAYTLLGIDSGELDFTTVVNSEHRSGELDFTTHERAKIHRFIDSINNEDPVVNKDKNSETAKSLCCFDEFWNLYPRRDAKADAKKAWKKIPHEKHELVIEGLKNFSFPRDQKFVPLPASWLNGERWEDEGTMNNKPFMEYF